jgi:RHS repeat-associated protein
METRSAAYTAGVPRQMLVFSYDWQGRRIQKDVLTWNPSTLNYQLSTRTQFVYDGCNLLGILNSPSSILQSFLWGLDLSGSLQGAGGVGGLVKVFDATTDKHYFPAYDGNGNVMALVDGSTGAEAARYEYGPFGEPLVVGGSYAAANPFRFTTKLTDEETGHLYYGYRSFNPAIGTWLNRDPLGDEGFLKRLSKGKSPQVRRFLRQQALMPSYAFAVNNPVNRYDVAGLAVPAVEQLVWQTGFTHAGYSCGCPMTLCEAIGRFIDALANSVPDYDDFQEYIRQYAGQAGSLLARDYETISGCKHKREFGNLCCHGFQDNLRMNGADNLRHFAGGLYWGKTGTTLQTYLSDVPQQWGEDDPDRRAESQAEIEANTQAGSASNSIENQLGIYAPWYVEDEESDEAWAMVKMIIGQQWRSRFCKPQE